MFTRQHYETIAAEFTTALRDAKQAKDRAKYDALIDLAGQFSDAFARDNPRFDRLAWARSILPTE